MPKSAPRTPETQSLVIEGDLARVTRTVVERQVRTADLLAEIAKLQPLQTGLLPRGCIAYARACDEHGQPVTLYVTERPAGVVSIKHMEAPITQAQAEEIAELRLSWPYTQWLVRHVGDTIGEVYVTCTKTPVTDLEAPIFVLPMPNIYDTGSGPVCLGNLVVPQGLNAPERTERLIEAILTSLWNRDLAPDLSPLGFETLKDWAARTVEDPEIGLKLDYKPHRHETLAKCMDAILRSET